jgi:hypothetical protein
MRKVISEMAKDGPNGALSTEDGTAVRGFQQAFKLICSFFVPSGRASRSSQRAFPLMEIASDSLRTRFCKVHGDGKKERGRNFF